MNRSDAESQIKEDLIQEEFDTLKKDLDEGGFHDLAVDALYTDGPLEELHKAFLKGNLTEIGIILEKYIDGQLREKAIRHIVQRDLTSEQLMDIARKL